LVGVSVRAYRELEAGDRMPDPQTYERMCKVFGRPRSFVGAAGDRHAGWGSVNVRPLERCQRILSPYVKPGETVEDFDVGHIGPMQVDLDRYGPHPMALPQ
jgi:hypothetical protein